MGNVTCWKCSKDAVYVRPYEGKPLCLQHFNASFEERVKRTIGKYKLLKHDDVVAVGLSGGKDSVALIRVLKKLMRKYPRSKLIAITIDEGIKGYREDGLKIAKQTAEELDVEHHIYSFREYTGYDLDDMLALYGDTREMGACSYCGVFRRKTLNYMAKKLGATKLATGHNLDDEAQTVLMNILRGDLLRFGRNDPVPIQKTEAFVPRIKPFRLTPQVEIVLYVILNGFPYHETPCPYSVEADRGTIRDVLSQYVATNPTALFNLAKVGDQLWELLRVKEHKNRPLKTCKSCGAPSANELCMACRLVQEFHDLDKKPQSMLTHNTELS